MMRAEIYQDALELTKQMVAIPSLNGTPGERDIALFVHDWLAQLPYFQANPQHLLVQELRNDPLHRLNVLALVRGTRSSSADTVIVQGHGDTVDIDDYGPLKDHAFDCDALPEKIRALTDDPEVLADIDSGEWMFGRGACDMKCGDAILMCLTRAFTQQLHRFDGNLVYMLNPVEENQHYGIMDALDVLLRWREEEGLHYLLSINTDFFSPAYPGDTHKYVHAGAVGKILPCFYLLGKPTHVGHAFEGFSVSLAAAEIVRQMELQADFADEYRGELTLPPLALRCRDLKPSYNVTTPAAALLYFNYFIHSQPMDEVLARLRTVAQTAMDEVVAHTDEQYHRYCQRTGQDYSPIHYPVQVLDYTQLHALALQQRPEVDAEIAALVQGELDRDTDRREISRMIVERLCQLCAIQIPTAVIFLAPPYCPRNTMKENVPGEAQLLEDVASLLQQQREILGEDLCLMQFFPVLSDSSYLKIDDDDASIQTLIDAFPGFGQVYDVPFQKIRALDVPAFSFGCYGKDGHKWTERVNLPYTFGKLPHLIWAALERYLIADQS